jgi:hypothetical protein
MTEPGSGYRRDEPEAARLDRNWAELLQELRVIGTGVQILFAFLLGIAFQARFAQTDTFQRTVYVITLLLSAAATALMITPVAVHRMTFRERVKDELVATTNRLALCGLAALLLAMVGSVLLVVDWIAGPGPAAAASLFTLGMFGGLWVVLPLQRRARGAREHRGQA